MFFSKPKEFMDMTVGEVIENQKAYELKKEQEELEKQKLIDEMKSKISIEVLKKYPYEYGYDDYNVLELLITNNTEKVIKGVKASIYVYDMFDDKIKGLTFSYDEEIQPKQSVTYTPMWDCNQFDDGDMKLKNTELEKLKFDIQPDKILFNDGTLLELPE